MSATALFRPLVLPNGAIIPNRIAKAAMEENLKELFRLYKAWAEGGAGLIITGNVMVAIVAKQLELLSRGKSTNPKISPLLAFLANQINARRLTKRYRKWTSQA